MTNPFNRGLLGQPMTQPEPRGLLGNAFARPMTQPQNAFAQLVPGNIDLTKRPKVRNSDGSISTVRSFSFNYDGKEVLVPTVSEDGRIMSDDEAVETFYRTGRHLGIFDTPEEATTYAKRLHDDQAKLYLGR